MAEHVVPSKREWDQEYSAFQERAGVPVHDGYAVHDVRSLAVDDWDRTGGRAAFINLVGMEGTCDVQIHEIPPGERLKPQRHLHDALVFVISGSGFTRLGRGEHERVFEWDEYAAFYLPRNSRYELTNAAEDEPARLLFGTPLPLYYTLLKQDEAIWENDSYSHWETIAESGEDIYASASQLVQGTNGRWFWESNFIPNALSHGLKEAPDRGVGNETAKIPFRESPMRAHISEFEPGGYKKAHRHLPGANLLLLSGEGYTLMWHEDSEERMRVDWEPYSLVTPPLNWYHQHFNTSRDHARYLVFHSPIKSTGMKGIGNPAFEKEIDYPDEDPEIRETFRAELAEEGIESEMDPELYEE